MRRSPLFQVSWAVVATCVLLALALVVSEWRFSHATASNGKIMPIQSPSALGVTATVATTPQQYWQVGANADDDGHAVNAMRTRIHTHQAGAIANQTSDYFWIGSYLADHSFIQVGYVVASDNHTPRWFYCTFDPAGKQGACPIGPTASAGPIGAWHTYALQATASRVPGVWDWTVSMDSHTIGTLTENAGTTGAAQPGIFAEQSAFVPHAATNDLGPVEFAPALEVIRVGDADTHFQPVASARAIYSTLGMCPPYGVGVAGVNDIMLGSHLPCVPAGSSLW